MPWNWQLPDWPNFTWDASALGAAEGHFLEKVGMVAGASKHLVVADRESLTVEIMTNDALDTSEIEGELLDRDSVQSSIRRQLGLTVDRQSPKPAEAGIAEMTVNNFKTYSRLLTHDSLFEWHRMVSNGRRDLEFVGRYRAHPEPMRIVSIRGDDLKIHFEAPPSATVHGEMDRFLQWFAQTGPEGSPRLPILTRAGIAHVWFESIHPFEDGNGRIGRAIAEKAIMQGLSSPTITALSTILLKHRKAYYKILGEVSRELEITKWLTWFSDKALEASAYGLKQVEFLIEKSRILRFATGRINPRQEKALLRIFAAGPDGFKDGITAKKYIAITGATTPTATRDLGELVKLGILERMGERKSTRYRLVFQ